MTTAEQTTPEIALTSLAILKVNWDRHQRDHIANFVPFVVDVIRELPQDEIGFEELQRLVAEKFGLAIPHGPLKTIVSRACHEGLVRVQHGVYLRTAKCADQEPIGGARDEAIREYTEITEKLVAFASERHGLAWEDERAEHALFAYAAERAGPILATQLRGAPLPATKNSNPEVDEYVLNTFVVHLHERDAEGFGFLESVVKGSMLAHALYYPDLGTVDQRMRGVEVFFDTRVILQALVGNDYEKRARRAMFELVYELGGIPRIFEDTLKEVESVLQGEAQKLRRGTVSDDRYFGVLTQQLIERGMDASDIELVIARLPRTLGTLKITVTSRPKPSKTLTVDEPKLAAMLASGRRDGDPHAPGTLHDVDALTAVHRLRGGRSQYRLESCRAVFVTTNYPMVTASRQFFREEYDGGGVPHCYGDGTFETLVWLKKPLRAPDLPRRRILADCLSALRPSEEMWANYSEEIERLRSSGTVTEDDFVLLKHSLEAKTALLDATKNDVSAFGEGTVQEVLRRSKAVVQGDAADEISSLQHQLQRVNDLEAARTERIQSRAALIAHRTTVVLLWGSLILFTLLAYLTLPTNGLSHHFDRAIAPIVLIGIVVLDAMTLIGFSFGVTLRGWLQTLEVRLARGLIATQAKIGGVETSDREPDNNEGAA